MPPLPAPGSPEAKRQQAKFEFLILFCFALPFLGMALALGTEPHWFFERTGREVFRLTGSNHFAGYQFYIKTIEGVESVSLSSGYSRTRRDSPSDRQKKSSPHLTATGLHDARMSWSREEDSSTIDAFMRSDAPSLLLIDRPAWWRQALTWISLALGTLLLFRAVRSFFPKK